MSGASEATERDSAVTIAARAILQARGVGAKNIAFDEGLNLPSWTDAVRDASAALTATPSAEAAEGWQMVPKEPIEAMLEMALDVSGQRVVPFTAERESGVEVESSISEEDAASINESLKAAHAEAYRAMLDAAPAPPLRGRPTGEELNELKHALSVIRALCVGDASEHGWAGHLRTTQNRLRVAEICNDALSLLQSHDGGRR
jgi:hypothetical protein